MKMETYRTLVKSESEVVQLCLTLHDPMDCSPPGSSAHGIFQARVLARPGIEPMPPALDGGFLTTGLPEIPEFGQIHVH